MKKQRRGLNGYNMLHDRSQRQDSTEIGKRRKFKVHTNTGNNVELEQTLTWPWCSGPR